jgi:hypothetical protein
MSILNGQIHFDVIHSLSMPYGSQLDTGYFLPLEGCADIAVDNHNYCYVAHKNKFSLFSITKESRPALISELSGLGASRQIAIGNNAAFITARADGLFVIDLADIYNPALCARIDTVELATGIAVDENICYVACRHMGVELWDITNLKKPVFISRLPAGEAQSVFVKDAYLYVGDWMNRKVHIVDVSNPSLPRTISMLLLDGYADGVFIQDGYCYAATGHHSSKLKNRRKYQTYSYITAEMMDDGYGMGHGLEIFDISDPADPEFVSSIKFPPFYLSGYDTWRVKVHNDIAYVADSCNGLFVVNAADKLHPEILAHYRLPVMEDYTGQLTPPSLQKLSHPVSGLSVIKGKILLAGVTSGFHIINFDKADKEDGPEKPQKNMAAIKASRVFCCDGQVHSLSAYNSCIISACGNSGLYAIDAKNPFLVRHHLDTKGIAHDVQINGDDIYVAEGQQGLAKYHYTESIGFELLDRILFDHGNTSARQVVCMQEHNMAAVQLGTHALGFVNIEKESKMEINSILPSEGMMYHRHICRKTLKGFLAAMPLSSGLKWYGVNSKVPYKTGFELGLQACPIEGGAASDGDKMFFIFQRCYTVISHPHETPLLAKKPASRIDGAKLKGMPFICGKKLLILNRTNCAAECLDITNEKNPKLIGSIELRGEPGFAMLHEDNIWFACGHAGIYIFPYGDITA